VRDLVAAVAALALVVVAASLATTLTRYRRRRQRTFDAEGALGRAIVAEIPGDDDLLLFREDEARFYYGVQSIEKASITAARVLINGAPIAAVVSSRAGAHAHSRPTSFEDRPEGIARDRWDVAIEAGSGVMLVACGAIRERVSQELARAVFDAVKRSIERLDQADVP
jgi:hypothetical protein